MKKMKKTTVVFALLLLFLFVFFIKMTFVGYGYSGVSSTLDEIEVLKEIGLQKIFGVNQFGSDIEYYVKKGYIGRGYISILLHFKTNKEEFIKLFLNGMPYEEVEENLWYAKQDSQIGIVETISSIDDKISFSKLKQKAFDYLSEKYSLNSIDSNDFYGQRTLETQNRNISLKAIFDVENGSAIILIQSSFK